MIFRLTILIIFGKMKLHKTEREIVMDASIAYEYLTGKRKFDPAKAQDAALRCAEEGIVLLTNGRDANGKPALPLEKSERIAFFSRNNKNNLIICTFTFFI